MYPNNTLAPGNPALTAWYRRARWAGVLLSIALSCLLAAPGGAETRYQLYYVLELSPMIPGYELDAQFNRRVIYTGILRGTLGGLAVTNATFVYRPGASTHAGGGEFTLQTAAGPVRDGRFFMTSDDRVANVLFFAAYLGTSLEFRIEGPAQAVGQTAFTSKGLAVTGFASHTEYLAAVRQGVANLAPDARAAAIRQADGNPALVSAYRRASGTP